MICMQRELVLNEGYAELVDFFSEIGERKVLLICDGMYQYFRVAKYFDCLLDPVKFLVHDRVVNSESVKNAVSLYKRENCTVVRAVGGDGVISTARCVALSDEDTELIVMPTTADGFLLSEKTKYSYDRSKAYDIIFPSTVIIDNSSDSLF